VEEIPGYAENDKKKEPMMLKKEPRMTGEIASLRPQ
jgi:hypothetical protein